MPICQNGPTRWCPGETVLSPRGPSAGRCELLAKVGHVGFAPVVSAISPTLGYAAVAM